MDTARATSFGGWADEYDNWRPTYPDVAVDWLRTLDAALVAEIGAGTGKLTDRLTERHLELDVVEPDGRMLEIISQRHPRLRTHETGATSLPLSEASVDAVVVADAWHWFPKDRPLRRSPACSGPAAEPRDQDSPGAAMQHHNLLIGKSGHFVVICREDCNQNCNYAARRRPPPANR